MLLFYVQEINIYTRNIYWNIRYIHERSKHARGSPVETRPKESHPFPWETGEVRASWRAATKTAGGAKRRFLPSLPLCELSLLNPNWQGLEKHQAREGKTNGFYLCLSGLWGGEVKTPFGRLCFVPSWGWEKIKGTLLQKAYPQGYMESLYAVAHNQTARCLWEYIILCAPDSHLFKGVLQTCTGVSIISYACLLSRQYHNIQGGLIIVPMAGPSWGVATWGQGEGASITLEIGIG